MNAKTDGRKYYEYSFKWTVQRETGNISITDRKRITLQWENVANGKLIIPNAPY